jgi:hypothetical protein
LHIHNGDEQHKDIQNILPFSCNSRVWTIFSSNVLQQGKGRKEGGTGNKDRMKKWEGLQNIEKKEGGKDKKM